MRWHRSYERFILSIARGTAKKKKKWCFQKHFITPLHTYAFFAIACTYMFLVRHVRKTVCFQMLYYLLPGQFGNTRSTAQLQSCFNYQSFLNRFPYKCDKKTIDFYSYKRIFLKNVFFMRFKMISSRLIFRLLISFVTSTIPRNCVG